MISRFYEYSDGLNTVLLLHETVTGKLAIRCVCIESDKYYNIIIIVESF